ncbi:acid phosphatase/Vanadium-dependent haloperoxidase [Aulographum hederae CBS 113979]|uniref:Acid phosphatase/Vanadium-dependent haloperoxidase n=1 Tax=Aulographum hederae CBS 113979 TaxID=1176131 RepID=A0A6G1GJM6_9PEZI|nr:acid phosphatase/Vanadium-dependent haloperoxidase [Aulographum hederae CBS 113979]
MVILPPVEEDPALNRNYIFYWNSCALDLNRITHSLGGPQGGPPLSARILGVLHIAMHDAYFGVKPSRKFSTYLSTSATADPEYRLPATDGDETDPVMSVSAAAVTILQYHYTMPALRVAATTTNALSNLIDDYIENFPETWDALSPSYRYGVEVAKIIINLIANKPTDVGVDQGAYRPSPGPFGYDDDQGGGGRKTGLYRFDDDPTHPVRLVPIDPNQPELGVEPRKIYHGPFYGMTAKRIAVQFFVNGDPNAGIDQHILADPPVGFSISDNGEYNDAVRDIVAMGGTPEANATKRRPDQRVGAYFWAYDGTNLIGTPPRLYDQILRKVAWQRRPYPRPTTADEVAANDADFIRVFALANAAMADAGIFAWQEKYCFEFWRPLSGVREGLGPYTDPFFLSLGAPETNSNQISFKPPFPAYPSGHATFGAATFQAMRLYYKARDNLPFAADEEDNISFTFVSDEMNGVNRDLRQPYDPTRPIEDQVGTVRTRVERNFPSLWHAIFDNALSRIWLGVHWRFDAAAAQDILLPPPSTQPVGTSLYKVNSDGATAYMDPNDIKYKTLGKRGDREGLFPIGGVGLGIGIANDIFGSGLKPTPKEKQPDGRHKCTKPPVKPTMTTQVKK